MWWSGCWCVVCTKQHRVVVSWSKGIRVSCLALLKSRALQRGECVCVYKPLSCDGHRCVAAVLPASLLCQQNKPGWTNSMIV